MDPWESWYAKAAEFIRNEKSYLEGWITRANKEAGEQALKDFKKELGERFLKWVEKNPPPPSPPKPKPPKPAVKKVQKTVDITQDIREKQWIMRNFRKGRRGGQGIATLGVLIVGGTVSATAIGTAVLCYLLEEAAMTVAEDAVTRVFIDPTTKAEATNRYMAYVRIKTNAQQGDFPTTMVPGLFTPILSKEDWLWRTYQLRWADLR